MRLYPLQLVSNTMNLNFMRVRRWSFIVSILLSFYSILLLCINGLNFGIDFAGGMVLEARSTVNPDMSLIRKNVAELGVGEVNAAIFSSGSTEADGEYYDFCVKIAASKRANGASDDFTASMEYNIKDAIVRAIDSEYHHSDVESNENESVYSKKVSFRKFDFAGPQVSSQLFSSGIKAVLLSFVGIMCYVWIRFEWQFALGVLVALVHDVVLSLGFMSMTKLEFTLSSVAALLTIVGYSVNDSVVIYDRIRENLRKLRSSSLVNIINISLNETLSRTTMTVLTTLIANFALIWFGGEAIRSFSILVFFGIAIGTYSSIFISAPILSVFKLPKVRMDEEPKEYKEYHHA